MSSNRKVGDKVIIKVEAEVIKTGAVYDTLRVGPEGGAYSTSWYSDVIEKNGGKIKAQPKPTNRQLFDALPVGTRFRVGTGTFEFAKTGEGTFLRKNRRDVWESHDVKTWTQWERSEGTLRADGTL